MQSRGPPSNLRISPRPHRAGFAPVYANISRSPRIRRDIALLGAAGLNMAIPGSEANRIGSSGNLEPPRRITESRHGAIAVGFRRLAGSLLISRNSAKSCLVGAGARNMRPAGSAANRIGSSGHLAIPRRISEADAGPHRNGFGPLTMISHDLPEFDENGTNMGRLREIWGSPDPRPNRIGSAGYLEIPYGISRSSPVSHRGGLAPIAQIPPDRTGFVENETYLGRTCKICDRRITCQSHWIFRRSGDPPCKSQNLPTAPSRWLFADYSDFAGCGRIRRKRPLLGGGCLEYEPPRSAIDRIGSSRNPKMIQRI